ncbi:hypothetical protein [Nonomuraea terrae]|uniref:hypothetical protein n=1 Tax=Nonomuraea terrae TaxID=2530383 RepID=UPI0016520073|nr:hypothetical protein [Nonomuraea terrae]
MLCFLAPVIMVMPAFSIVPFAPMVDLFGVRTPPQLVDLPVAVLWQIYDSHRGRCTRPWSREPRARSNTSPRRRPGTATIERTHVRAWPGTRPSPPTAGTAPGRNATGPNRRT